MFIFVRVSDVYIQSYTQRKKAGELAPIVWKWDTTSAIMDEKIGHTAAIACHLKCLLCCNTNKALGRVINLS